MAHRHDGHAHVAATDDRRLLLVAASLLAVFVVGEVVAAVLASSLALLADAGHMFTDTLALLMAAGAAHLARRPVHERWTFGFARAEVLSAAVNGVTLLVFAALIVVEAVRRLVHPMQVEGLPLVVVAGIGLAVNVVAVAILSRADRRSLNIAGAVAHVVTDAYAFAATIVAGVVVAVTGIDRADSVASLFVAALMLRASVTLLSASSRVLLEAVPDALDVAQVREHLLATSHVVSVHDLHVWTSGSRLPTVSAHVVVKDDCFNDGHAPQVLDALQDCLVGHFDVEHSTFQLEPAGHETHEQGTH